MQNESTYAQARNSLLDVAIAEIQHRYNNRDQLSGIPTGLYDLDAMTGGLQEKCLIMLAARPSMGKTAFVLQLARQVALHCKQSTVLFCLEASAETTYQRLLIGEAAIDSNRLRTGHLHTSDWERLIVAEKSMREAPIVVSDALVTIGDLEHFCEDFKNANPDFRLLIVDDVQVLLERDEIVKGKGAVEARLRQLARRYSVTIVATLGVPRIVEARKNKRPALTDLSRGKVNADFADIVLALYRDEYYNPDSQYRGEAEIAFIKNRLGPVGCVDVLYQGTIMNFANRVLAHFPPA